MRRTGLAIVGLLLTLALVAPLAAQADQKFTLTISPELFQDMTGDSTAGPVAPNYLYINCPGFAPCAAPRTTFDTNLDYGLSYQFNKRWSIAYTHSAFDFSLGRISFAPDVTGIPGTGESLLTGDIQDRTDQGTITYNYGHGVTLDAYYASHQRIDVQGLCNNQEGCTAYALGVAPNGTILSNPNSINANNWGGDINYSFGPHTPYAPPMFKITAGVQYWPRPNAPNCLDATPEPACNGQGQTGYRGSGATFPYGVTMFPISAFHGPLGFIPFVGYQRLITWFHAENTAEVYNAVAFGFVQVLPHGLEFSYTNFKLNQCMCSDTLATTDPFGVTTEGVRSDTNIYKLTYNLKF